MTWLNQRGYGLHDTTHSPLVLYQFQGDLTDASGNGRDLTVENGTTPVSSSTRGAFFDGSTNLVYNTADSALRLLGDMTMEMLVRPLSPGVSGGPNSPAWVALHIGTPTGETSIDNILYAIRGRGDATRGFEYFHEYDAGNNSTATFTDNDNLGRDVYHLAMTRSSTTVTIYVNGLVYGSATAYSPANAPTDGSNGRLRIGGSTEAGNFFTGWIASFKLVGSALTQAQIQAEVGRTIG